MAELFSRKCTFESVPVRKIFSCKYLLHFWPKTRFQVCSLNWPEDTLSYQHVCISRRQDTAMIYFWFLAKCAHFYSSFGLENSVSFLVLRNRWFSFQFALDQGSFFSHCGKQAQLQSHPICLPVVMTNHVGSSAVAETSPSCRHLHLWGYKSHSYLWTYIRT